MQDKGFNLNRISTYREQLFGIAIISIIVFHYSEILSAAINRNLVDDAGLQSFLVLKYFRYVRSIGVEVFAFLSGVGLYYSYSKNSDTKLFYKKRVKRIIIPYLIVAVTFWAIKDFLLLKVGFATFLGDITFITFFTKGVRTLWYIGFILAMYALFPLFYKIIYGKNRFIGTTALFATVIFITVIIYYTNHEAYGKCGIALERVPIFLFGIFLGKYIKEGISIPRPVVGLVIITGPVLKVCGFKFIEPAYVDKWCDVVYACALILICVLFLEFFKQVNWLNSILKKAGSYSLELYMVHVTLLNLAATMRLKYYQLYFFLTIICISICLAVLLNKVSKPISDKLFHI